MKIKFGPLGPQALTTVRGDAYIRDTKHGAVVQAKPKGNRGLKTPIARQWQKRFGLAAIMASSPEPMCLMTAMEMAKGTDQVPRDILTMAALGRYYEIFNADGTQWGHVEGPVLQSPAEMENSMWEWSRWDDAWNTSFSTSNWSWKGAFFTTPYNQNVYGVRAIIDAIAGATYQAAVGQCTTARVVTAITKSAQTITPLAGQQLVEWRFDSSLTAAKWNFIMIGRVDATASTAVRIYWPSGTKWLTPWNLQNDARLNTTNNPVVGTTIQTSNAPGVPSCGILLNQ